MYMFYLLPIYPLKATPCESKYPFYPFAALTVATVRVHEPLFDEGITHQPAEVVADGLVEALQSASVLLSQFPLAAAVS